MDGPRLPTTRHREATIIAPKTKVTMQRKHKNHKVLTQILRLRLQTCKRVVQTVKLLLLQKQLLFQQTQTFVLRQAGPLSFRTPDRMTK